MAGQPLLKQQPGKANVTMKGPLYKLFSFQPHILPVPALFESFLKWPGNVFSLESEIIEINIF